MASCLFNFPITTNLVYTLYGIGIGPIFPTVLGYLKLSEVKKIHSIFVSKALATFLSPLAVNEIINKYGKKIYSSFAFLWTLAYILFFVGILNYHASKTYDSNGKYKFWHLFFGSKTKTARQKVRKVMRSFKNKSFKAITRVRYHARTWSTRRVNSFRQSKRKYIEKNNKHDETVEISLPSDKSNEEINIIISNCNNEDVNSNIN